MSTSVWGSELKSRLRWSLCQCSFCLPLCEVVSWNIPISLSKSSSHRLPLCEVVSWNYYRSDKPIKMFCRLPLCEVVSWNIWGGRGTGKTYGLPLCEVVSWNDNDIGINNVRSGLPLCEVVSWNTLLSVACLCDLWSTSVWGSELKLRWGHHHARGFRRLPLCEVVSWNVLSTFSCDLVFTSTSVWGSELK